MHIDPPLLNDPSARSNANIVPYKTDSAEVKIASVVIPSVIENLRLVRM